MSSDTLKQITLMKYIFASALQYRLQFYNNAAYQNHLVQFFSRVAIITFIYLWILPTSIALKQFML